MMGGDSRYPLSRARASRSLPHGSGGNDGLNGSDGHPRSPPPVRPEERRAFAEPVDFPNAAGFETPRGERLHRADRGGARDAGRTPLRPIRRRRGSAVADVHRDFEAETHLGEIRLGPHVSFLRNDGCMGLSRRCRLYRQLPLSNYRAILVPPCSEIGRGPMIQRVSRTRGHPRR